MLQTTTIRHVWGLHEVCLCVDNQADGWGFCAVSKWIDGDKESDEGSAGCWSI